MTNPLSHLPSDEDDFHLESTPRPQDRETFWRAVFMIVLFVVLCIVITRPSGVTG